MLRVTAATDPETGIERVVFFDTKKKVFQFGSFGNIAYDPAKPKDMTSLVSCFSRTHSNREFLTPQALSDLKKTILRFALNPLAGWAP